jgi:hypothetical protein
VVAYETKDRSRKKALVFFGRVYSFFGRVNHSQIGANRRDLRGVKIDRDFGVSKGIANLADNPKVFVRDWTSDPERVRHCNFTRECRKRPLFAE